MQRKGIGNISGQTTSNNCPPQGGSECSKQVTQTSAMKPFCSASKQPSSNAQPSLAIAAENNELNNNALFTHILLTGSAITITTETISVFMCFT